MADELDQRVRDLEAERARPEPPDKRARRPQPPATTETMADLQRVIHLLACLLQEHNHR